MGASDLLRRSADAALEATVIGSFTRLGPTARRALWGWEDPAPGSLAGKVVVVTGATSGLGAAIARGVAAAGATVAVVGRDPDRGEAVAGSLAERGGAGRFHRTDLAELRQVRALADALADEHPEIHALVHNAGALLPERRTTSEGHEVTWAAMVLAPHLLGHLLAERTDREIWMSSGGMYLQDVDLDDLEWSQRPWDGTRAYAQAKRAQLDLVAEATALGERPVRVAMHPGWAATPGVTESLPGFDRTLGPLLRSPEEGADTAIWLAAAPLAALRPGAFYLDRRPRGTVRWPGTRTSVEDRARLRAVVDQQCGLAED